MSGLSFREELEALGPSLYWPLDATDGATDQSGNGRNGTASGPTIGGHTATYAPLTGEPQSCTDLDGTDDHVTSTYNPFTTGTVRTHLGWAYRDTDSGYDMLWASTAPSDTPQAYLPPTSTDFVYRPGADTSTFTADWPGNGVWVFWVVVFDDPGNEVSLYIDGSLIGTVSQLGTYPGTTGTLIVGSQNSGAFPFDGKMAHVAVIEYEVTATNVTDMWDGRLIAPPGPPVPTIPDVVSAPALA